MWLMVLALGLIEELPPAETEFLRILEAVAVLLALSLRLRGREEGVVVI